MRPLTVKRDEWTEIQLTAGFISCIAFAIAFAISLTAQPLTARHSQTELKLGCRLKEVAVRMAAVYHNAQVDPRSLAQCP